jgi:hypothetical protein
MKKIIFILLAISAPFTNAYSQEEEPFDGFGSEGNGDAQTNAPNEAPIDSLLLPLLITGIITTIYFVRKKERQLKQN